MRRHFSIFSGFSKPVIFSVIISLLSSICLNAQSFRVFAVSDLLQVFEDGYKLPPFSDTINLFGVRGEIISGQFVINSKKGLTDVTVEISDLKIQTTGKILPASIVEWNFVGTIQLDKNTPNQPARVLATTCPCKVSGLPDGGTKAQHERKSV